MTEHPMLFSGPMVRAIQDGRKTQTRRPVLFPRCWRDSVEHADLESSGFWVVEPGLPSRHWQYGDDRLPQQYHAGDRLWVRETWRLTSLPDAPYSGLAIEYQADRRTRYLEFHEYELAKKWIHEAAPLRTSIHMPRWASRITLEITDVRPERVADITGQDAVAEGWDGTDTPETWFCGVWSDLYRDRHPFETAWCWRLEFRIT